MTKTILIYPPFCTPASPPFSITSIYSFLKNNLPEEHELDVLDLNIAFHNIRFPDYKNYTKTLMSKYLRGDYDRTTKDYQRQTGLVYADNNRKVIHNEKPEFFDALLAKILEKKPDIVAFSVVYSSQAFYTLPLIKILKENNIKTVVGGPAVTDVLKEHADAFLANELELLNFITEEEEDHDSLNCETVPDFSIYDLNNYFTPEPVIPIRTTSACYYRKCAFCTHYGSTPYFEYDLDNIKESIELSKAKHVFFVDDIIHKKRLLEIAEKVKDLGITWMCQLKPTIDLDLDTLKILKQSGLKVVIWGVESASNRILSLMQKGTNKRDIQKVLKASNKAGIKNTVYIMFGFPSESEDEFIKTINFLNDNAEYIDLISTSVFGLQKDTIIFKNPGFYGITNIKEEVRTILEPKISYEVRAGLSTQRAMSMRRNYKATLNNLSKFPRSMNFFREHMLCLSDKVQIR